MTEPKGFERWWKENHRYFMRNAARKDIARAAWAAGIDWWSGQLDEVVRMPPKQAKKAKLVIDKS
jgi:hypothetical protein